MFNLNAKGPLFAVQKLSPLINRGGSVVLTTSVANVKGMPGTAAYGAAKAALRSFARTLAADLLSREIRVNAVTPGPIDTPIIGKVFTGKDEAAQIREKMTGSNNKTARQWDLRAKDPAANPVVLSGHDEGVRAVAISVDSRWVVTGSDDSTARLWHLQINELVDLARAIVRRNFSSSEWQLYFPGEKYRKTFDDLPGPQ
jgi:NAD(P)-dependent dehydrogenase (short-subunit alcohol dehydrogenase family)